MRAASCALFGFTASVRRARSRSPRGQHTFCVSRARVLLLAREAIAIVGYGAGKKDVSGSRTWFIATRSGASSAAVKHDSPAIVL